MSQQQSASQLRNSLLLVILSLFILLSGCGKSHQQKMNDTQKKLIGTWQEKYVNVSHPTASIFLEDGSFQHKTGDDIDGTAKWQVLPDGKLKLTEIAGAQKPTLIFKLDFSGETELTMTEEGETESLQTLIKIR